MGFRIISKIAAALGVVLVIVVLLEFVLLNFYVKETNVNFPKEEHPPNRIIDGVWTIRLISTSSPEESRIEKHQSKLDESKR